MISNVFIGSSAYALPALEMLCNSGMSPSLVISQPDKPAGRNLHTMPTPVSEYAVKHGLPLIKPENINSEESLAAIAKAQPEVLITASYGGFLGKQLRFLAPLKAINLHPSLLPRYRGASPIQSTLLGGESVAGTTIFRLVAEMDAGPIIAQETLDIGENENYSSLHDRLANQAAQMLHKLLVSAAKPFTETPQEHNLATWCPMIDSSLCMISWDTPANAIHNKIRAFSYIPGAWVYFRKNKLKLLSSALTGEPVTGAPGTIAGIIKNTGFTVNCLDTTILITEVQAAGKKMMEAQSFVNGARILAGEKLWM